MGVRPPNEIQERGDLHRRFRIVHSDSHEYTDAPGQAGFLSRIRRLCRRASALGAYDYEQARS
jgi:hypothetical protein